jgi:carbon monoxide dehydrogenase subunit G
VCGRVEGGAGVVGGVKGLAKRVLAGRLERVERGYSRLSSAAAVDVGGCVGENGPRTVDATLESSEE